MLVRLVFPLLSRIANEANRDGTELVQVVLRHLQRSFSGAITVLLSRGRKTFQGP